MKKIAPLFLSLVMLFALTVPAFASEGQVTAADANTYMGSIAVQQQNTPLNMEEIPLQNIGDIQILAEDEVGVLFIELVDKSESDSNISRAGTTKEERYVYDVKYAIFYDISVTVVRITATATWVDNGANSYIENLNGHYEVYNDSFTCAWDDSKKVASNYYHVLALDISHGIWQHSYSLTAGMSVSGSVAKVTVMINEYE